MKQEEFAKHHKLTSRDIRFCNSLPVNGKARRFVAHGCIVEVVPGHTYDCKPIPGYNKTTYSLRKSRTKWTCDCQGFKRNQNCTHLRALFMFFKNNSPPQENSKQEEEKTTLSFFK